MTIFFLIKILFFDNFLILEDLNSYFLIRRELPT